MRASRELHNEEGTWPNDTSRWAGESGQGGVIVYSRAAGWVDWAECPNEDRNGWPFMGRKEGELIVQRVIWDPATETIVAVVE